MPTSYTFSQIKKKISQNDSSENEHFTAVKNRTILYRRVIVMHFYGCEKEYFIILFLIFAENVRVAVLKSANYLCLRK